MSVLKAIDTKFDGFNADTKRALAGAMEKLSSNKSLKLPTNPSDSDAPLNFDDYAARWKSASSERVVRHVRDTAECRTKLQQLGKSTFRGAIVTFTETTGPGKLLEFFARLVGLLLLLLNVNCAFVVRPDIRWSALDARANPLPFFELLCPVN
ncbi:hypothetical protein J4G43_026475 [Bradyrhizobium barranii subsp. barranii]|uniref:Uncharacterized protein n=1 Tax=Bradyrhizobium barranii subsp. barranii TaxID=2823807 RepID=A0A939S5S8_9BRAD|nr:hypothetical protein [Bradyrhizobium barranii]UEM08356.1 hypothetical protein J4G43_026475 [Bradyrhizobium barranii subsp. barranii]